MSKKQWGGQPKVILVEGDDCRYFVMHIISAKFSKTSPDEVFVQDFCKVGLNSALRVAKNNRIEHLLVILDAETRDYESAKNSMKSALKTNGLCENAEISVAYFIISKEKCGGNLEELCLASVHDESALAKANVFVDESRELFKQENPNHKEGNECGFIRTPHKSRLAAYLSIARKFDKEKGKLDERGGEFATLKLGEAANAGAFNFDNQAMKQLLAVLENFLALRVE